MTSLTTIAPNEGQLEQQDTDLSGLPPALRGEVRLLGGLLGRVIANHRGSDFVGWIEAIRVLAKRARQGSGADWGELSDYLSALPEDSLVDVARAFNQFLNLANIADQGHAARNVTWPQNLNTEQLARIRVELVLTAHPTATHGRLEDTVREVEMTMRLASAKGSG